MTKDYVDSVLGTDDVQPFADEEWIQPAGRLLEMRRKEGCMRTCLFDTIRVVKDARNTPQWTPVM